MKQFSTFTFDFLKTVLLSLIILFSILVFGQDRALKQPFKSKPITDVFARNAVTPLEMIERTKYHPYMKGEIVVALEVKESKASANMLVREYEWSQLFGDHQVHPLAYLMTKELRPGLSVSLVHLSLPEGLDVFGAMNLLDGQSDVLWSSPNFYFEGDPREIIPNDPSYGSQYHHPLMKNNLAWDITFGNPNIIIGITDDGVSLTHTDLAPNIWVNTDEIAGNGIDDDSNGYIDDVNGWDFSSNNNDPNPNSTSNDHGTHVAGISAARTNNSIGVAGVSGHSKIMAIQFYGVGSWTAAVCNASFTYAANNGAKVVNTSYNIDGFVGDPVFTAGMQYMHDAGVLHFNSGGNNSQLNPPRQAFQQSLMVVSTDASDLKSSFSNYGTGMDISTPGSSIYSTVLSNGYGTKSGTSMASPNAAGAAALIWSANPTWNSYQVAAQLLATADNIDGVNPTYAGLMGSGRANTYAALTTVLAPPIVKSLTGMPAEGSTVPPDAVTQFTVSFSQVMDPATVNNVANYELRGAGPDNTYGTGDDAIYTVNTTATYMLGTNQMTFTFGGPPFINGLHRLRLISGGLKNPFGTVLDGNGNGVAGDDWVRNFNIGIPPPVANFSASNTSPIPGEIVTLNDLSTGAPSAWTWTITPSTFSFVNGTNANSQNPQVQFTNLGAYSVTLFVSNVVGSDTETKTNYINVITCSYCSSTSTTFNEEWISNVTFNTINNTTTGTAGYNNYTSIFSNVTKGTAYTASVSCGSTGSWVENIWIFIDWNQDCDFIDTGESFDLGQTTGPGARTLSITIPTGATTGSTRMRVSLKYNADPTSCESFQYGEVEDYSLVVAGSVTAPVANFSASTTTPNVGQTVTFTDLSSNTPTSWNWSFSPATVTYVGGTSSTSQNPQVQFNAGGFYSVTLTATNAGGSDGETKTNYIFATAPPVSNFSASTTTPNVGQTVTFSDLSTNTPTSWNWSFSPATVTYIGGTTSASQNPQVQFNAGGFYSVTLTATNAAGSDGETKTNYIFVTAPPVANFSASTTTPNVGQTVTFTDLSTNFPTSWSWSFNPPTITYFGGTTSGSQNPQVQFNAGGFYSVTLTATNAAGSDGETKTNYINVPYPFFNLDITVFLEGPFNGNEMNTLPVSLIPLSQPYNIAPWNYIGSESVGVIPNPNVVDWILVELRDAPDAASAASATMFDQKAAFILKDGSVVGLDGSSNLSFEGSVSQNLYVVLWHRNHVGIMSNNALPFTDGVYTYNFSTGVNQVYGGVDGHKELASGIWGMFSGDGNSDGNISSGDKSPAWEIQAGTSGYIISDYNLDSESNNIDKTEYWTPNIGRGSQVPN